MIRKIFGTHDDNTIEQMNRCIDAAPDAIGVLCADGHFGYSQPVGGVVAYRDHISVSGVGFDIGCGNMAARTDLRLDDVRDSMTDIMDEVVNQISFGVGRSNQQDLDWELINPERQDLFDRDVWQGLPNTVNKQKALAQLGTVGSGNHYIDIFADQHDHVWVGVHFGSRGLGHKIATHYLREAGGSDGMMVPPALIEQRSRLGEQYLAAMHLAGDYAYAGREWVTRFVVRDILCGEIEEEVHNHHNFAWREEHDGQQWWVVRKGATPAQPDQRGFVGGSMGDNAVIIAGVESEASAAALYSTVHGAGRVMGRMQARGKFRRDRKTGKMQCVRPPAVDRDEMRKWLADKEVVLRGGDLDEAPQAYRRLTDVLACHEQTIRVLHTLRPLGVAMAGPDTVDPYKD